MTKGELTRLSDTRWKYKSGKTTHYIKDQRDGRYQIHEGDEREAIHYEADSIEWVTQAIDGGYHRHTLNAKTVANPRPSFSAVVGNPSRQYQYVPPDPNGTAQPTSGYQYAPSSPWGHQTAGDPVDPNVVIDLSNPVQMKVYPAIRSLFGRCPKCHQQDSTRLTANWELHCGLCGRVG